jgi:hypothetical protein
MSLEDFVSYVGTWSGLKTYQKAHPGVDLLTPLYQQLKGSLPAEQVSVNFPITLFLGKC